jgi:hypothetical protein
MSQEVASNKLENGPIGDYKTGFCSPVALTILEKKTLKKTLLFSLPVWKIFRISEPCEQILKRIPQGTYLQNISFLGVIVSEKKMFKEKLTPGCIRK